MRNKKIWILSLVATSLMVTAGYLFNAGIVWGTSALSGDKYVTDIRITDSAQEEIGDGGTMLIKEIYNLDYDWEIPDNTYKQGDELDFSIPKEFKVVNNFKFNLNTEGEEVAKAEILGNPDSGYFIRMTFTTDYVETHSDVSGTFNLSFILNEKYVTTDSNNTIVFPPDFEIVINVPNPGEPGEGGTGEGAGDLEANVKTGNAIQGNLAESPDVTSTIFEWEIQLGRDTILSKVDSLEDIQHIFVEDSPKDQRMVGLGEFDPNWDDSYGFDGVTYTSIPWEYGGVPAEDMGLIHDSTGTYIEGFHMDLLPRLKEYHAVAVENDTEMIQYELKYYSVPLNEVIEDTEFTNEAVIKIVYNDGEEVEWTLQESLLYNFADGTITGKRAGVEFKKVDAETGDGLDSAVFDLYKKNLAGEYGLVKSNITSDNNGTVKVDKLTTGEYYFVETEAPEGYTLTEDTLEFEIETADLYSSDQELVFKDLGKFENAPEASKRSIKVQKDWQHGDNPVADQPTSISVQLYADDKKMGDEVVLDANNNWKHEWTDLDEKANGNVIEYKVKEVGTVTGYTEKTEENPPGNFKITNTYVPETISINGEKHWKGDENHPDKRPESITINLFANGDKVDEKTVTGANNWTYEFTDLPKYSEGYEIDYMVIESTVPNYSSEPTGEYDVTNIYAPGQKSLFVKKDWEDNYNQDGVRPPKIMVQLYADGEKFGEEVELNADNDWEHNWTELEVKDTDGHVIKYTVKEVGEIPGYTATEEVKAPGTIVITNTHIPERTEIEGEKHWTDNDNQDGKRPESIKVNLLADGKKVAQQEVTGPDWKYEFTDLPKYSDGKEIEYTVKEETVKDYTSIYNTYKQYDIENQYTPGVTSISVEKHWNDNNNQDGIRPTFITVQLLADGKKAGEEVVLNQGNNWNYTWNDLAQKSGGIDIAYTVEEVGKVTGYETETVKTTSSKFDITNTHVPETTEIGGTKHWEDKDNQDGKRPEKITVNLLANGQKVSEQEVTGPDWNYEFTDLPKYSNGVEIEYSVVEKSVIDYSADYEAGAQFDITNHYTPGETEIRVEKYWNDNNNQDGIKPASIKVQLYADGQESGKEVTLNDENNWKHTWSELDLMASGKVIEYTVQEVGEVPGYTVETDVTTPGVVILTNSHTPEVTEVSGEKTWNDKNNQDGKRPETITVNLLADGQKVDQVIVTEMDNWVYEFKDLPKYNAGQEITYSVTEDQVIDYSTEITGMDLTNNYTPGQTSLTVTKAWDDQNDKDGIRPSKIKVQLYADGEKSGKAVSLNAKNNWTHTWDNLDEKANGETIVYTVEEITEVEGYETVVNNQNIGNVIITNSHTPTPDVPKPGTPTPGKPTPGKPTPNTPKPGNGSSNHIPQLGESAGAWTVLIGICLLSGVVGIGYYQKASRK